MSRPDVRAVENPISALFDLAEDVNKEAPRFRKLVRYAALFIVIWLVVDFVLILATIQGNILISVLLVAIFVLGLAALSLLSNLNDFFRYYVARHRAIMSVRTDDPIVKVPAGPTPVARLLTHLRQRNPELNYLYSPNHSPIPVKVRGRSGRFHELNAHLVRPSGPLWGLLGVGYPGYQMMIRTFSAPPRPEELMNLKGAAEDISGDNRVPPSRVIALWPRASGTDLSEESYDLLMSQVVQFFHRRKHYASSLELIIENVDGTYEFIPYVTDQAYFPSR